MALPRIIRRLLWVWGAFALLLIALFAANGFVPETPQDGVVADGHIRITLHDPASVSDIPMVVDLADTPDEWRRGLQNRPVVDRGMLFVFPDETPRSFWMKDTLAPLDIGFFRADGTNVSSYRMEPCLADPCATYSSNGAAKYALELPAHELDPLFVDGVKLSVGSGS